MEQNIRLVRIIFWKSKIQIIESTKIRGGSWEKVTTNELSVAKVFHKVLNKGRVEEIFEKSDYEVLGKMLYEILTANSEVKEFIEMLINRSTKSGDIRYKVMLQFEEDTHELAGLPWEYLLVPVKYNNESFYLSAGKNMQFDFVRDYDLKYYQDLPALLPSKQLAVIWIFVGERRFESEAKMNFEKCEAVFEALRKKNRLQTEDNTLEKFNYYKIQNPTKENIKNHLRDVIELIEGPYVLHFLGHAEMRKNDGPYIGLSSGAEFVEWVKADLFNDMFKTAKNGKNALRLPHLVLLQACDSAQINEKGEGLAIGLIKRGIPAVLAMQNEISLDSSLAFIKRFYTHILDGEDVAFALTQCRYYLGCNYPEEDPNPDHHYGNNIFGTPVLYTSVGEERIQLVTPTPVQKSKQKYRKICKACAYTYKADFYSNSCVQPKCNGILVEVLVSESTQESGAISNETNVEKLATSSSSSTNMLRSNETNKN